MSSVCQKLGFKSRLPAVCFSVLGSQSLQILTIRIKSRCVGVKSFYLHPLWGCTQRYLSCSPSAAAGRLVDLRRLSSLSQLLAPLLRMQLRLLRRLQRLRLPLSPISAAGFHSSCRRSSLRDQEKNQDAVKSQSSFC